MISDNKIYTLHSKKDLESMIKSCNRLLKYVKKARKADLRNMLISQLTSHISNCEKHLKKRSKK